MGPCAQLGGHVTIYVLTAVAIYHQKVIYLAPPSDAMPEHVAQSYEWALVVALNVAIAMLFGSLLRGYTGPGPAAELIPDTEKEVSGGSAA